MSQEPSHPQPNRFDANLEHRCIVLTPSGRGAIAVILTVGPNLESKLGSLFSSASGRSLSEHPNQSIFYGTWNATGEDVMLVRAGSSRIEIHCHGGEIATRSIVESLVNCGFELTKSRQAFQMIHGSRWQAEYAEAAAAAKTEKVAGLILRQYLKSDVVIQQLVQTLRSQPRAAIDQLSEILRWSEFGLRLTQHWSVVFCGNPNVGKSSLMNAVLGFGRTIVHRTAGTTRDVVSHVTAIDGWPVEFKDTAGLREAESLIERKGVELAKSEIDKADLAIMVLDATEPNHAGPHFPGDTQALIVFNKVDLITEEEKCGLSSDAIQTSAINGYGLDELLRKISAKLIPELPPEDSLIPVSQDQVDRLTRAIELAVGGRISESVACLLADDEQPS